MNGNKRVGVVETMIFRDDDALGLEEKTEKSSKWMTILTSGDKIRRKLIKNIYIVLFAWSNAAIRFTKFFHKGTCKQF